MKLPSNYILRTIYGNLLWIMLDLQISSNLRLQVSLVLGRRGMELAEAAFGLGPSFQV